MDATTPATLQQAATTALPGTWKLVPGRAVTLRPLAPGLLRVAHGEVWATVDGPHGRTPDDAGDHVLAVGRSMWVRAGQRVVIEAWGRHAAFFSWDPVACTAARPVPRLNFAGVLQPLADLRLAGGLAGAALARLARGLGGLALDVVRPRGAVRGMRMG